MALRVGQRPATRAATAAMTAEEAAERQHGAADSHHAMVLSSAAAGRGAGGQASYASDAAAPRRPAQQPGAKQRRRGHQQEEDEEDEEDDGSCPRPAHKKPRGQSAAAAVASMGMPGLPSSLLAAELDMLDGFDSNGMARPAPKLPRAVAGGGADTTAAVMCVWGRRRRWPSSERATLRLNIGRRLGSGGFGSVFGVKVAACELEQLKNVPGAAAASLQQLILRAKRAARASKGAAAPAGGGGGSGSGGSGVMVPLALKLALRFDQLGWQMQEHFGTPAEYARDVRRRMAEEHDVMAAAAGCPHVVDVFAAGDVFHGGVWRPALLMELAELGDVQQVYMPPCDYGGPDAPPPRGLSSALTQRIVRHAALGLQAVHRAGFIVCDLKPNNCLVFGSREAPIIKVCDFGCAKELDVRPKYGPVSGTHHWKAFEQIFHATPLDYCTDSWPLGLLVLALRRGRKPFWWVHQAPAELASCLADDLSEPDCPYSLSDPGATPLTPLERDFVQLCMEHSMYRPPAQLLEEAPYLSGRYRGG